MNSRLLSESLTHLLLADVVARILHHLTFFASILIIVAITSYIWILLSN